VLLHDLRAFWATWPRLAWWSWRQQSTVGTDAPEG
jgi:hypothetical protein